MPVRARLSASRVAVDPAVCRRPQLERFQVRAAQEVLDAGRDFVGEVYYRTCPLGVQERYAANHGCTGAHVPAANGARENQDVGVMFLPDHGSIILGATCRRDRADQRRIHFRAWPYGAPTAAARRGPAQRLGAEKLDRPSARPCLYW